MWSWLAPLLPCKPKPLGAMALKVWGQTFATCAWLSLWTACRALKFQLTGGTKQFAQQLSNSSRSTGLSVTSLTPTRPKVSRQGVAPSSHDAASQYIRQCDELGATASDPSLRKALANEYPSVQTAKRRLRKWTQNFKKVWGLGFGPLWTRNPIPQAELEEKAGGIFK